MLRVYIGVWWCAAASAAAPPLSCAIDGTELHLKITGSQFNVVIVVGVENETRMIIPGHPAL